MPVNTHEDELEVWIDQDLCTGDGICAQYAPEVFELDIDGLAYVKDENDELCQAPGAAVRVPLPLVHDVVDATNDCLVTASTCAARATGWSCTGPTQEH